MLYSVFMYACVCVCLCGFVWREVMYSNYFGPHTEAAAAAVAHREDSMKKEHLMLRGKPLKSLSMCVRVCVCRGVILNIQKD